MTACKKAGKSCGTQIVDPDSANTARAFKDGFTFVVLSSDLFALWKWGERMRRICKTSRL